VRRRTAIRSRSRARAVEDRALERVDLARDHLETVGQRVHDRVDHPVDQLAAAAVRALVEAVPDPLELDGRHPADRQYAAGDDVDVDLDRARRPVLDGEAEEDEQQLVVVPVELRALAELETVLDGQFVQPEHLGDAGELLLPGVPEVEPDRLVAGPQVGERLEVDGVEGLHGRRSTRSAGSVVRGEQAGHEFAS
jgi:hypothetical protein